MKDKLKPSLAYFVVAALFLGNCLISGNFVYFPIACCFIALGSMKHFQEQGRLPSRFNRAKTSEPKDPE